MRVRSRVAALVLTGLLGAACGRPGPGAVASMTVTKGTFEVVIPAFGELQAAKSTPITVSPARRGGIQTVAWIAPDYSVVKGGDVVVRLASRQLPELLKTEQAELAKIDLEITQKEKQLEKEKDDLAGQIAVTGIQRQLADVYAARDETIYPRNKIIEDAIDLRYQTLRERYYQEQRVQIEKRIAAELALLQARAKARQVQIQQYRDQLDNLDIRAPHDGTLIISKRWDGEKTGVGMTVFPGYKLAALPDLRVMEAKVFVLESEASGLKEGLAVQLVLDYEPGRSFGGRVAGVDKIAKPLSQESPMKYFETRVEFDATDPKTMKPGLQVKASIFVERLSEVVAIPNQALVFEQGRAFVLAKKGSRIHKVPVETGARSLTRTVITKGLSAGAEILLGQAGTVNGKPPS